MSTSGALSRVVTGIALIVLAVGGGLFEARKMTGQSDRDFAICGSALQSPECQAVPRPINVTWTRSSDTGFETLYELDVQTGKHTTMFFTGLTRTDVAPLQGLTSLEVHYRNDRPVAVIWPDGTPIQIPFAPSHDLWTSILAVMLLGIVGGIFLLWGIVRAVRGPRTASYAY